MEALFREFGRAYSYQDGHYLASTITPIAPPYDAGRLYSFYRASNAFSIQSDVRDALFHFLDLSLPKPELNAWVDIFVAYWKFLGELLGAEETTYAGRGEAAWGKVYDAWKDVVNQVYRGYSPSAGFQAWTVPLLYVAGTYLRNFAIKADEAAARSKGSVTFNNGFQDDVVDALGKNEKLEDAARQINRIFSLCHADRAAIEESRKWGLYFVVNLLFKTYFRLNSISLCKNLIRSLQATKADMPDFELFPKSHRVTFKYYAGVVAFLDEDYRQAEDHLTEAWRLCHKSAQKNLELILTYLIPCHLLTSHTLPTRTLLAPYPRLRALFDPLATCIKRGDLAGFDRALQAGEDEFVKRRIYLTLERGRDIALRNLLRKVFIAGGYDEAASAQLDGERVRRSRVPIAEFWAAVRLGAGPDDAEVVEQEEVECMIANMIYKNFMKGYISRQHGLVVLSKAGAFPGTGV